MNKSILAAAAVAVVAGVGFTAFAANDNQAVETVANSPRPTVTQTVTAPPVTITAPAKPAPTVTTTQTVTQVPQACLDALDNADEGFGYAAQAMNAAGEFDIATMNAVTEKLGALAPTWNANKAACRAAGTN